MFTKQEIFDELRKNLDQASWNKIENLLSHVQNANKIFLTGAGRVGLCAKSFAMRLAQLGKEVYVLGGVTTPPGGEGDLLISCSAGGTSVTTVSLSQKAKEEGLKLMVISANPESELWDLADYGFYIPGPSRGEWGEQSSIQPLGTVFEQSLFIFFDAVVLKYMEKFQISEDVLKSGHCNLE